MDSVSESIAIYKYIGDYLSLDKEKQLLFLNHMTDVRKKGGRIYGPSYTSILQLNTTDPRESLDIIGTALLNLKGGASSESYWQIKRKLHSDPVKPGNFRFMASCRYLWFPHGGSLEMSFGRQDLIVSASQNENGTSTSCELTNQDEWGFTFEVSRMVAEQCWRLLLPEIVQSGALSEVVTVPTWPQKFEQYRVPYLSALPDSTMGHQHFAKQEYSEAIASYDKAIAINPYDPINFGHRAQCHFIKGQLDLAYIDASMSMQLNPTDPFNYWMRSQCLRNSGKPDLAVEDAAKAVLLDPANPNMFIGRGTIFQDLGKTEEARADYRKALQLDPSSTTATTLLMKLNT